MMRKLQILLIAILIGVIFPLAACSTEESQTSNGGGENTAQSNNESDSNNTATATEYPQYVTIAGATSGGTYFLLANALAQLIGNEFPDIDTNAKSTPGGPVILEDIQTGQAELGLSQAGVAEQAFNGTGQFEGNPKDKIRQLTYFYPNVMQFVVKKGSGIESIEDVAGRAIAVGAAGSATELNTQDLIHAVGLTYDDIKTEYVSESQAIELLRNNQIEGANMIAALGSSNMLDILSTGEYEIVEISEETISKLQEINAAYYPFTIPADTYPNQPEPIQTYAVANWLHGSADLSEEFVYELLTVIYDNVDFLVNTHAVASNINIDNALDGQTIPLHEGAVKFFEEHGYEIENGFVK